MFHVNVPDVMVYTVRLLRKAQQQSTRVQVLLDTTEAQRLSQMLWGLPDADFLPHALWTADITEHEFARTPMWLDTRSDTTVFCPVVINLTRSVTPEGESLNKVIEVVGQDDAAVAAARQRWKAYLARAWTPEKFER